MAACTPYPITFYENGYELLYNHTSIENQNIINSDKINSGAEIKFWLWKNKINFDNDTYKGFWPFVNPNSKNVVVDNKYYFVVNDKFRRQQFQVILDKSKIPRWFFT